MNCKEVQEAIYRHFINYEYKLFNTVVFDWESDFLAKSKSGYWNEVEVKISRADFFRDFKKPKHKIFRDMKAGRKFSSYVRQYGQNEGDLLAKFQEFDYYLFGERYNSKIDMNLATGRLVERDYRAKSFIVNDWRDRLIIEPKYRKTEIKAPNSKLAFHDLSKQEIPHQFYFACPDGLIKPEEITPYAGLIYITDGGYAKQIKRAPYLHKRSMDLTATLLKKFYNLWTYKTNLKEKLQAAGKSE